MGQKKEVLRTTIRDGPGAGLTRWGEPLVPVQAKNGRGLAHNQY